MKIWTCESSPRSGSRNAWKRIKNVNGASRLSNFSIFFRRDPNDFQSRLVTKDETWLYHYGPETKQQLMVWRHSGSPRPKKFRVQKSAVKVHASIFWDKYGMLLIIFQRAKLSTRSITHLCWCNWRTFWRKNAAGRSPRGSCSCTTMPRLTGHLQPRKNWPTWASNVLITHHILRIWPRRTSWTEKNNWKVATFRPTRRSLLPWRPWLDWQPFEFLFSGLQKLEQRAKKCIELRGEYVEQISSLVAVDCFLPGRAKDLSAPPAYDTKHIQRHGFRIKHYYMTWHAQLPWSQFQNANIYKYFQSHITCCFIITY